LQNLNSGEYRLEGSSFSSRKLILLNQKGSRKSRKIMRKIRSRF